MSQTAWIRVRFLISIKGIIIIVTSKYIVRISGLRVFSRLSGT